MWKSADCNDTQFAYIWDENLNRLISTLTISVILPWFAWIQLNLQCVPKTKFLHEVTHIIRKLNVSTFQAYKKFLGIWNEFCK